MKLFPALAITAGLLLPNGSAATEVKEITSPSGLTAWLVEDHSVPLVSVRATFAQGELNDPPAEQGSAKLLSGLVDEGTGSLSGEEYRRRIEDLGLRYSINAELEDFDLGFSLPTANLAEGLDLVRRGLAEPTLPEEAVERMRKQFLTYEESLLRSPGNIAVRAFINMAAPGHPYGSVDEKIVEGLRKVDRTTLRKAHNRIFSRKDLKVAIVGDVSETDAKALLEKIFSGLPEGGEWERPLAVKLAKGPSLKIIPFNTPQTLLTFGGPGIADNDPDYLAATVAVSIISATISDIARQQRGLTYDVSYSLYEREAGSITVGQLWTSNATASQALDAIKEALSLARHAVRENHVEATIRYMKGQAALGVETNSDMANLLQSLQIQGFASNYLSKQNELLDKVKVEDVRRVMLKLADPDNLLVVAVGQPEGLTEQ
jgi:zinc protease